MLMLMLTTTTTRTRTIDCNWQLRVCCFLQPGQASYPGFAYTVALHNNKLGTENCFSFRGPIVKLSRTQSFTLLHVQTVLCKLKTLTLSEQHMPTSCQHEQESRFVSKPSVPGRQGSCIAAGITRTFLEAVTSEHTPTASLAQSMQLKTRRVTLMQCVQKSTRTDGTSKKTCKQDSAQSLERLGVVEASRDGGVRAPTLNVLSLSRAEDVLAGVLHIIASTNLTSHRYGHTSLEFRSCLSKEIRRPRCWVERRGSPGTLVSSAPQNPVKAKPLWEARDCRRPSSAASRGSRRFLDGAAPANSMMLPPAAVTS